MMATGRYLYGLIRTSEPHEFGAIGLEDKGAPARVYTVCVDSIGAVVSDYGARGKVLPLRKNLEPHHKVINEVMKTNTIVPMTFGHVARSEERIKKTVLRNRDEIIEELDRLGGNVEMTVKVTWDVDNIFEYFVARDQDLAAFRDEIFGRSSPPTQAEKIELGQMFEDCLASERETHAERVVEAFRDCVKDSKVNPPKGEKTVVAVSFLVERSAMEAFERRVYEVAGTFSTEYVFDYSGPWAPFNFVELDLRAAAAT